MLAATTILTFVSALSLTLTLTSAAPSAPSLEPRSHFDAHGPTTPAETPPPLPISHSRNPRGNPRPIYIHAPTTRTYVILRASIPITNAAIRELLLTVSRYLDSFVQEGSDGPIAGGELDRGSPYFVMAQNANNHQITYGVLGKALQAMADWMFVNGDALVKYEVWDGDNMVGRGLVGKEVGT